MAITKELIDGLIVTIQNLYLADDIPWMIGYSGGKDSTAAVQLVWMAIEKLPETERTKTIHVMNTDTLVESPVVSRWVSKSLSENTIPTDLAIPADSNLEMSWYTFGGEYHELYEALVKAWCIRMNLPTDDETVAKYFRLNLERGIAHLSGTGFIKSIDDLTRLAIKESNISVRR